VGQGEDRSTVPGHDRPPRGLAAAERLADELGVALLHGADPGAACGEGRGGTTSVGYDSAITQVDAGLEADAAADASILGETGPGFQPAWRAAPVVSSLTATNVDANDFVTSFLYAAPKFDPVRRVGLGFRLTETTRDDGSVATTFRWQEFGIAGRESRQIVSEGGIDVYLSETDWETFDVFDDNGSPSVTGSVVGARIARPTAAQSGNLYGGDSGATRTLSLSYDDDYGFNFVDQVTTVRPTGTSVATRVPETADLANWIVGLTTSETVVSDGVDLRRSSFAYEPGRGLLTALAEEIEVVGSGSPTAPAITTWAYDAFGNVTQTARPTTATTATPRSAPTAARRPRRRPPPCSPGSAIRSVGSPR